MHCLAIAHTWVPPWCLLVLVLCFCFACLRPASCVHNATTVSGLSIMSNWTQVYTKLQVSLVLLYCFIILEKVILNQKQNYEYRLKSDYYIYIKIENLFVYGYDILINSDFYSSYRQNYNSIIFSWFTDFYDVSPEELRAIAYSTTRDCYVS